MKLTSRQLNQLHQALLHSFDRDALRMMVRLQLDENLEAIAGNDDLATVLFDLITWAERTNRVGDLVNGALASNPNNPELQQLAADYARWQTQGPVPAAPSAPIAQPAAQPVAPPAIQPAIQPSASPVTLPVERARGTNWLLPAGVALVLLLIAVWLLRPVLFPTGSAEPTPVALTPGELTAVELTPVEPTTGELTPVEATPVESTPVESTPVEPPTGEATAEPTEAEPAVEPTWTIEPPTTEAISTVESEEDTTPPIGRRTPIFGATLLPNRTLVIKPDVILTLVPGVTLAPGVTPTPPRAPALKVGAGLTAFNEDTRLLNIESGQSVTVDMRQLWSAPVGTPVDCASGFIVASWQVRQPYPGGEDLEIRRTVPRAGGQTELLASGARGNVTLGYCDELILQNLGLEDYRLEWRYVSALAKS